MYVEKMSYIKDKEVDKMQLSKRETQLIELFIKHGMTLTAQELAEFANVSTKTIYRTIKKSMKRRMMES